MLFSVDHLAHVFDFLRSELKQEAGKQLFITYQATPVILYHLKPINKVHDVLIALCFERTVTEIKNIGSF